MRILLILIFLTTTQINAKESIKDICIKVGNQNSTWNDLKFPEQKIITDNDYNINFTTESMSNGYDLFRTYNHSNLVAGHKTFLYGLAFLASDLNIPIIPKSQNETLEIIENLQESLTILPNIEPEIVKSFKYESTFYKYSRKDKFINEVNIACYSVLSFVNCQKAIKSLIELSKPSSHGISAYVYDQVLIKTFTSKIHVDVLKIFASQLLQELNFWIKDNKLPSSLDFYERILKIAESQGQTKAEAQQIALEILATYSLRGAAYFNQDARAQFAKTQSGLSFLILSSAISYFDKILFNNTGKIVSLPNSYLQTTCLYGKPYHFWLSAYMSNLAHTELNFSKRKSFLATHLIGIGYELQKGMFGDMLNRGGYFNAIIEAPKLDQIEVQIAKVDVLFNALGAGFGVQDPNNIKRLNVDKILRKSLKTGIPFRPKHRVKPGSGSLPYTFKWMSIVRPHSHINMIVSP